MPAKATKEESGNTKKYNCHPAQPIEGMTTGNAEKEPGLTLAGCAVDKVADKASGIQCEDDECRPQKMFRISESNHITLAPGVYAKTEKDAATDDIAGEPFHACHHHVGEDPPPSHHDEASSIHQMVSNFVQAIWEEHKALPDHDAVDEIKPFDVNSMFRTGLRFAKTQQTFRLAGKNTQVDIGYHYTENQNMDCIREHGLLSKRERETRGIKSYNYNGSTWGDGIYTANVPHAFDDYGDIGLLVARLQGTQNEATQSDCDRELQQCDAAIANQSSTNQMVILAKANQCIPLLAFPAWMSEEKITRDYHLRMLKLVNHFFNKGRDSMMKSSPVHSEIYERTLSPDDDRGIPQRIHENF